MSEPLQRPESADLEPTENSANRVLETVRQLVLDLHPAGKRNTQVRWDSRLDRELGIDSLGRAELLSRLEHAFQVRLPQTALAEAETPRELLAAVQSAGTQFDKIEHEADTMVETEAVAAPVDAATLTDVLDWHVREHPDRTHVVLWDEAGGEPLITYGSLANDARAIARGLLQKGFEPGARAAIMLPTGKSFFQAFFGILYAGGVPVPIYPPARLSQIEDHLRRQARILDNAAVSFMITVPEARPVAAFLKSQVQSLRHIETTQDLHIDSGPLAQLPADPARLAMLQYTSGSTGDPKGVMLTHANLLANIRAFGDRLEVDSTDVCVSWLPLYHDMGLIGTWLGSLYFAGPAVIFSPLTFLARPEQWLWAVHRHRGTISAAPNFAFELCLRKIEDHQIEGLDLSCWRRVLNGAEPVSPATIRRFSERFAKFGFRPEAMAPVYGMAESAVGVTIPPLGRLPIVDQVDRTAMTRHGEARPASADDANALEFVACGQPLRGHQVRIVDSLGREVEDRHQGRLQFRGPSATQGYYGREEASRQLYDGDWLNSGDLAYIAAGDVYITGRSKDIIIRAGRNLYPHELEEAIGNIDGVRKGCVAVFAASDKASGTERMVVVAETRLTVQAGLDALRQRIEERSSELLDAPPDEIVLVPPNSVPKTSSGKIRRTSARELYESNQLARGRRALWLQMARLGFSGFVQSLRRARRQVRAVLYGVYFWAALGIVGSLAWISVALSPSRRVASAIARTAARRFFEVLRIPVHVTGLDNLPVHGGILIANHASYLDGVALIGALPATLAFVAKKELAKNPFTRIILARIGARFVERFEAAGSLEDSRTLSAAARAGEKLMVFPEGTFTRMPGLLTFRMGAFVTAAESQLPLVPIAIRGTRSILRDGVWLPGHAPIRIEISHALCAEGSDFQAAVRLRDQARREILKRCGEPDLAGEQTILNKNMS